uniref:Uncharacterized protein n=1 Tax=Anguilla anguilla TaxID=7936 RepID=A0A0E9TK39_ANGAN
MTESRSGRC